MVHIYTGDGKGKTTASLGLALRALGWGMKVCLVQFLKKGTDSGELKSLRKFERCEVARFGRQELLTPSTLQEIDYQEAKKGLQYAKEILRGKKADILILDEINIALLMGLLQVDEVKELINYCPPQIELILTGRGCPEEILQSGDYVSNIREIRHPYQKGAKARKGIEF